ESLYSKALLVLGDRPEVAPALMYLGLRKKSPAEAIECLQRAQSLDPSQAGPVLMWMARIRDHEQNPREAEELYKSALWAEKPDSADSANTMFLYAQFLQEQGRPEEASPLRERATKVIQTLTRNIRPQQEISQSRSEVYRVGPGIT